MFKNGAYYNGIGPYLKEKFGMRIAKVSVDGGFTCPNRDAVSYTHLDVYKRQFHIFPLDSEFDFRFSSYDSQTGTGSCLLYTSCAG